jgi:tetratricopeptide (TPR) repeat protein
VARRPQLRPTVTLAAWLVVLLGAAAQPAAAYEIEYSADRPAALVACDALRYRGQRSEATACYTALLVDDADTRVKAEAARALGDVRSANRYFQTSADEYPDDPYLRVRWGRLFSATHQDNEAVKLYQESLGLDEAYVPALLGLAEISAARFEDRGRRGVEAVLDLDADNIGAHLLLARMELEVGNLEAADTALDQALETIEARGLAPLEVYALKASADLLRGILDSPWTERALAYNPSYGEIYATPAYFYVITRRYREAIDLYEKAVTIQPDLDTAHAELGVNLLRENRIDEAQRHLAIAYATDPYSARTVNTLRLIDSFDNFTVTAYGPESEPRGGGDGVILRLQRDEAPVLTPYVLDLVNSAITTFSERYGFEPAEPVIAELYPNHDDFAVRTSGLPGIGLLGVTFGYLVAMDSPSGRADGEFHWGTTLWHEMAHVFTLETTRHLVPRWFSEGASVFEEWATGPLPGRHIPIAVLQAMADDRFLPVADLDSGFIRPTYEAQVIVSYMQAGLICEYISNNWGQEALRAMLARYREGDDTAQAIEAALGITAPEFDEQFAAHVAAEFTTVLDNLEPWQEAQSAVHASAEEGAWAEAQTAAERAIALYPDYVDEGSAYLILAKAQDETGDEDAARETLAEYHRRGGYDPAALIQLSRWQTAAGEQDEAIAVLEDGLMVAPLDETVHAELGDLLLAANRPGDALREFEALFALDPHDKASAHLRLARAYLGLDDRAKANEHLLYALEIAPHFREAQQLLLEIVRVD